MLLAALAAIVVRYGRKGGGEIGDSARGSSAEGSPATDRSGGCIVDR